MLNKNRHENYVSNNGQLQTRQSNLFDGENESIFSLLFERSSYNFLQKTRCTCWSLEYHENTPFPPWKYTMNFWLTFFYFSLVRETYDSQKCVIPQGLLFAPAFLVLLRHLADLGVEKRERNEPFPRNAWWSPNQRQADHHPTAVDYDHNVSFHVGRIWLDVHDGT